MTDDTKVLRIHKEEWKRFKRLGIELEIYNTNELMRTMLDKMEKKQ